MQFMEFFAFNIGIFLIIIYTILKYPILTGSYLFGLFYVSPDSHFFRAELSLKIIIIVFKKFGKSFEILI
jgi:hypothetical protein